MHQQGLDGGRYMLRDRGRWRAPMERSLPWLGTRRTSELPVKTLRSARSAASSIVTNALLTDPEWSGERTPPREFHAGIRAGRRAVSPGFLQLLAEPRRRAWQRPTTVAPHSGHAPGPGRRCRSGWMLSKLRPKPDVILASVRPRTRWPDNAKRSGPTNASPDSRSRPRRC